MLCLYHFLLYFSLFFFQANLLESSLAIIRKPTCVFRKLCLSFVALCEFLYTTLLYSNLLWIAWYLSGLSCLTSVYPEDTTKEKEEKAQDSINVSFLKGFEDMCLFDCCLCVVHCNSALFL